MVGKGNKERTCYFNDRTKHRLKEYLDSRVDDNPYLFVSGDKHCKKLHKNGLTNLLNVLGKDLKMEKVHAHRFRRTFATNLMLRGLSVDKIKDLMGHESIETTMIYTSVSQEDLKYAHRKYTRG